MSADSSSGRVSIIFYKKAKRLLSPVFLEMEQIVSGVFKNNLEKSSRIIYQ
jgi:hypothetical protein